MKQLSGRHVLFMFLGFFGVVFLANIVFVYLAVDTFTGVETDQAYVKGLSYNEILKEAEAQDALGWDVAMEREVIGPRHWRIVATFKEAGRGVRDLAVRLEIRRPAEDGHDEVLELQPDNQGRYSTDHVFPLEGQWILRLFAEANGEPVYRLEQRAWVR